MIQNEEPTAGSTDFRGARWFWFASAAEFALAIVALILGYFFQHSPLDRFHWRIGDVGIGLGATIPPFLFFVAMLKSKPAFLRDIRQALEQTARPLFEKWSILQLATISIAAGVGEEFLFRGFIQEKLMGVIGVTPAWLAASILFGCVHPITWNYALVTAIIGVYLGGVLMLTGNLLAPIVTHAAYDFIALVYFLKMHGKS